MFGLMVEKKRHKKLKEKKKRKRLVCSHFRKVNVRLADESVILML